MADQWFKFYGGEYLADPKMLSLSPSERSCWLTLMCFASVSSDNGKVKHLTEERLMIQAGIELTSDEWDVTKGVLNKFMKLEMIKVSDTTVTITHWAKRQERYMTGAERMKQYRERKKSDANVTDSSSQSDARIEENRIDNTNTAAPPPNWTEEVRKKADWYRTLILDLASNDYWSAKTLNLIVLDEFIPYWSEKSPTHKKCRWQKAKTFDPALRIRNWLRMSHERKKDWRCNAVQVWHQKSEKCHHTHETPPPLPISQTHPELSSEVKILANKMTQK